MYGETVDPSFDSTFGFIAARAARYPVVMRRSQLSKGIQGAIRSGEKGDSAFGWLLLNTLATNRFLREPVESP